MKVWRNPLLRTAHLWVPGYVTARRRALPGARVRRVWLTIADHFEPWWRQPDSRTALARVERWSLAWPRIAERVVDTAGRPLPYTFFYPEEQYNDRVLDALARMHDAGVADVEVHLHHDRDTESAFVDRVGRFTERLHAGHGLLRKRNGRIAFGFIHGNWALDNSLPGSRFCGLDNEITLLRDLGCYADFTLPAAPSPAQTRMVNTIYWATDDPNRPKSHDTGEPVRPGGPVAGDLMMIPGPLTINMREWTVRGVPRLECGELAGHCLASAHRARLWIRVAPRLGEDVFIKLFAHGAPEKNAEPLLAADGVLERTLQFVKTEAERLGADVYFVSAWQMWSAIDRIRCQLAPTLVLSADRSAVDERAVNM